MSASPEPAAQPTAQPTAFDILQAFLMMIGSDAQVTRLIGLELDTNSVKVTEKRSTLSGKERKVTIEYHDWTQYTSEVATASTPTDTTDTDDTDTDTTDEEHDDA